MKSAHFPVGRIIVVAPDVSVNCRVIETLFAPLIAIKKSGLFIQIRISMSPYALWSEVTINAFIEVKCDGCLILTIVDTSNIVHINTIKVVSNLYKMPREYRVIIITVGHNNPNTRSLTLIFRNLSVGKIRCSRDVGSISFIGFMESVLTHRTTIRCCHLISYSYSISHSMTIDDFLDRVLQFHICYMFSKSELVNGSTR